MARGENLDAIFKLLANRVLALPIPFLNQGSGSMTNHSFKSIGPKSDNRFLMERRIDSETTNPPGHAPIPDLATRETQQLANESYASVLTNVSSTLASSIRWCPTSEHELARAESELLSGKYNNNLSCRTKKDVRNRTNLSYFRIIVITKPFRTYFVDIGQGWGRETNKIRTIEMTHSEKDTQIEKKQPLVMVHGFAAGIGIWILNLDFLATHLNRKIYAFDMVGFARSSRAPFDLNGDVEGQFVDSFEKWREKQGIEKFILLGHSFGGYLSASYALKYPNRISHIILADPWGFQDRQGSQRSTYRFPLWVRAVNSIFQSFNPLAVVRVTGPYGPRLVHKFRGDLKEKFRPKLGDDCYKFLNYIYHCNAQAATGESAFKALALPYGWPKNPMLHRLIDLDPSITVTFIYGSRSWIEKTPGEFMRDCFTPNRVSLHVIQGSGHHVYADKYTEFNEIIKEACGRIRN